MIDAEKMMFLGIEFPANIREGETLYLTDKVKVEEIHNEEKFLFNKAYDSKSLKRSQSLLEAQKVQQ